MCTVKIYQFTKRVLKDMWFCCAIRYFMNNYAELN